MEIKDKNTFLKFISDYTGKSKSGIFRGVSSDKYKLIPSIGRVKYKDGERKLKEKDEDLIFRFFKQRAKQYISTDLDEMNLLSIAQHHGLPTRLLDWTMNPLVAAYFAVEKAIVQPKNEEEKIKNSVIYFFDKIKKGVINKKYKTIKVNQLEFFIPNYNDQRIINQHGCFTIHPYPWSEIKIGECEIISINLDYRRNLRKELNKLGINQSTIYPGLDGSTTHIKWMETNYY